MSRRRRRSERTKPEEKDDEPLSRRGLLGLLTGAAAAAFLGPKLIGRASARGAETAAEEEALWRKRRREIDAAFEEALQSPRYR